MKLGDEVKLGHSWRTENGLAPNVKRQHRNVDANVKPQPEKRQPLSLS